MADVPLTVIPGMVWQPETPVDHARLNQTANPVVKIPEGAAIGPEHLDMPAILGEAGDTLRGQNFLRRRNFWVTDWVKPENLSCALDVWTENALDWEVKPDGETGAAGVTYNRLEESPNQDSRWCAQLIGATDVTACDFVCWVPADIAASLRGVTALTFSIWVKNHTGGTAAMVPICYTADGVDKRDAVTEVFTGPTPINIPGDVWTRVDFTLDATTAPNFHNGIKIGLRTTALTAGTKSLQFAQAQLEIGPDPSDFIRPLLSASAGDNAAPVFGDADRPQGADLMVQVRGSNLERVIAGPPPGFLIPVLSWDRSTGFPVWIDTGSKKRIFVYVGNDQILTVPAVTPAFTFMTVQAWGAGGGRDPVASGGVGAYAKAKFPVATGQQYTVVVGRGQTGTGGRNYGYGGAPKHFTNIFPGGGLAGIFTGVAAVLATDAARALLIAGGGGGGGYKANGTLAQQGGNGNDGANAGGASNFQGSDAAILGGVGDPTGGGGGGYVGGYGYIGGYAAKGGTSFIHASGTDPVLTSAAGSSLIVPNNTDPNYQDSAGQPNRSGLVVITFE